MPSPFAYTLLAMAERSGTVDGRAFELGGRTSWTAQLHVARLAAGGSVTVVVEAAPTEIGAWASAGAWAAQTTETTPADLAATLATPTLAFTPRDRWVRARVSAATGAYTVECVAWAPYLDPSDPLDMLLVGKALREYADGKTRIVERAERDVRSLVLADHESGELDVDADDPHVWRELRETIAEQADHLMKRDMAIRKGEEEIPPDIAPGLLDRVNKLRPAAATVWRGR